MAKSNDPTRDAALLKVLQAADLHNEDGHKLEDFKIQGRDALDFCSISRWTLRQMLEDAYYAGKAAQRNTK